jgi:hypothetical protein
MELAAAMTPNELRKEASAAEFMSRVVSYAPDKEWLMARAAFLRQQADLAEQRSWKPAAGPKMRAKGRLFGGASTK